MQDLYVEVEKGSRECVLKDVKRKKHGVGILDALYCEAGAPQRCCGVWITERRFQYIDWDITGPPQLWLYFLIVVPAPDSAAHNECLEENRSWMVYQRDKLETA